MEIRQLLEAVRSGEMPLAEAEALLKKLPYENLGFARLDHHRRLRSGCGEVIFCQGKEMNHLVEIFRRFAANDANVLGSRCSAEQFAAIAAAVPEAEYDPVSRIVRLLRVPPEAAGCVAVCCGGTADFPVAEEAAQTAEFFGSRVERFYDVGVAGIHRLFAVLDRIREANCVVAAAGMEGALPGVVAGLVENPVIALPTSVGYGTGLGGVAALASMLNSCCEGMTVVNIDNGFGAGYVANRINQLAERRR